MSTSRVLCYYLKNFALKQVCFEGSTITEWDWNLVSVFVWFFSALFFSRNYFLMQTYLMIFSSEVVICCTICKPEVHLYIPETSTVYMSSVCLHWLCKYFIPFILYACIAIMYSHAHCCLILIEHGIIDKCISLWYLISFCVLCMSR